MNLKKDKWNDGDSYEYFMGRWSSLMAIKFLQWLQIPPGKCWLDIGCGTGALSEAIEKHMSPADLSAMDKSASYVKKAKQRILQNQNFKTGEVDHIPFDNQKFDVLVSGLALNFFPSIENALLEFKRVTKPGGVIGSYVWDYSNKMEFLRYFWDAAYQIDPSSKSLDEGIRFPLCSTENLVKAFTKAGITDIESSFLDIETIFKDFNDYWNPFLGGQGPAPSFLQSLPTNLQNELKDKIVNESILNPMDLYN